MKIISKIISIVFLSFSILLLCYIFYRSQIFHSGTQFDYYLKYYVIAFLFIIFSFISFFIQRNLKIKITFVIVSTIIGLYFVERYLTIANIDKDKLVIYKNNTGKNYDKRTKFEIYQDLKKKDPNIVIVTIAYKVLSSIHTFPLSGLSNRKTIYCNENGYYSIYQTDRYGFNNPDVEWDKDKIDYLLVGDSFTLAACVNEPDTISGNLRKLNNNRNGVLNLGQQGNGPLIEYATLREYLPVKKVKRVLWMYFEHDELINLHNELKNEILVNYLKDKNFSQNLILRKQEIEKLLLKKFEQEMIGDSLKFVKLYLTRKAIFPPTYLEPEPEPDPATILKEFENILKLSNELVKENNSKLYFVYLPYYMRYIGTNSHDNYMKYKKVIEIVESLSIPIIDLNEELFEKHKDPLSLFPFSKIGHYNELGYQLVAETIFKKISELEK